MPIILLGDKGLAFEVSLQDLAEIIQAIVIGLSQESSSQLKVLGISTDTRSLQPNHIFLALKGDRFDGHHFVEQAVAQGAIAAIVQRPLTTAIPQLQVPDTLQAYQAIARWWRQALAIPIVAITGSVGKTTTKELIAAALSTQGTVLKTQANYNNEIGVPKTLLEMDQTHQYGVVEMGMRAPGEIALLAQIAQPNVAVITNVGTAHIGRLGSEQAIADAKCELLAELPPSSVAVLNYDNSRLMATAQRVWSGRQITFGLTGGDIQGRCLDAEQIEVQGIKLPLPLTGQHNAVNFLAAIATMEALGLDWRCLQAGLTVELPSGRARRIPLADDILLLDETYNAGVESMTAALHLLKAIPGQRHIAVLGTMKELGDHSLALHQQIGHLVQQLHLDQLLILADPLEAQALATGAGSVPTQVFTDHEALLTTLKTTMQAGDRILFKASRAVALDRIVNALQPQALA